MTKFNMMGLKDEYGFEVENTPMGEQRVIQPTKLAGTTFIGNTFDTNFWLKSEVNGGTVTQSGGQITVQTNTTANGAAYLSTKQRARYMAGSAMRYRSIIALGDTGEVDNKRRWGVADWSTPLTITDGAFFQLDGATFGISTLKGSTPAVVNSGSFNGELGATYELDTNAKTWEIYWTNTKVFFVIGNRLLHTVEALTAPWTNTPTLYAGCDSVNSNNLNTNHILYCRVASIYRLGQLATAPTYYNISSAATYILKYGAGHLHRIILNNPTNNAITVYDNIAASGTKIATINPGSAAVPVPIEYGCDFSTGLTIVSAGAADITVIYE